MFCHFFLFSTKSTKNRVIDNHSQHANICIKLCKSWCNIEIKIWEKSYWKRPRMERKTISGIKITFVQHKTRNAIKHVLQIKQLEWSWEKQSSYISWILMAFWIWLQWKSIPQKASRNFHPNEHRNLSIFFSVTIDRFSLFHSTEFTRKVVGFHPTTQHIFLVIFLETNLNCFWIILTFILVVFPEYC